MSDNSEKNIEKSLGVAHSSISKDQLQAAYALNLCAVSVSQIIDYNDINILEQEYEAILNNLNLENIPKDEALLDIIKRLLETITFFRIQEGDKKFIEKDYQQKMKNAIWSAMPNPGALISTGLSKGVAGMAVSLAATVGTAYMNYRKNKAEFQAEKEKQYWELKKTAIEQFQALQQQLFETSWRLADKYEFPDALRLTERQIKQYNAILMDSDEVRKFERLDSIKHRFAAYPPFWYFFGNTANCISLSEHYGLDQKGKKYYREFAKKCFEYFTIVNKYDLLREDNLTASCYLEYVDLLDPESEKEKISELLKKAVLSAGNSLDVLQLCAMAYLKIGARDDAAIVLRQLVNEKYNEVTNAQLLSTIYVNSYIENESIEAKNSYNLLKSRICVEYLFPWPSNVTNAKREALDNEFIKMQRSVLLKKYQLVLHELVKKYQNRINRIIPLNEIRKQRISEDIYAETESSRKERIHIMELALMGSNANSYVCEIREIPYSYEILKILNEMFGSLCKLECVQDEEDQLELQDIVKKGISSQKNVLESISGRMESFDGALYKEIQEVNLKKLTSDMFSKLAKKMVNSVNSKTEMRDFAIAEFSLVEFCKREGITEPEILFAHKDDARTDQSSTVYFSADLIGDVTIAQNERIKKNHKMADEIRKSIEGIVQNVSEIEFYTLEDPRVNRYFYEKRFRNYRSKTLAVLDDRSKGDMDLIFTTEGLMPVIRGKEKAVIPYSKIDWSKNAKKKELVIGVKYYNENLDMDKLKGLIDQLKENEALTEQDLFY